MTLKSTIQTMVGKLTQKPPQENQPERQSSAYILIGEREGVHKLANRFYDIMQTDPKAKELLGIHPQPMDNIRHKFYEYLTGWLGGPPLYEEKYGHPRLRARHLPFKVSSAMRDQWMYCMNKAMDEVIDNPTLKANLLEAFNGLATHMINTED